MTKFSVNVNKVATLRNTRPQINFPSVTHCAKLCLDAGAEGITVHPRPDQRHIKPADVYELNELLEQYPDAEFNIEGNPFIEFMHFIEKVRPTQATLVPDTVEQSTSNSGWDLQANAERLIPVIRRLHELGARVSLFMDPHSEHMELAKHLGADRVELYTEPYATAFAKGDPHAADAYAAAAVRATEVGLEINAGHDLNLLNLTAFLKRVPRVAEVSIGHALIGDALEFGLPETVKKYLHACTGSAT
jgi:pyridoxine 5-phosphate synthase